MATLQDQCVATLQNQCVATLQDQYVATLQNQCVICERVRTLNTDYPQTAPIAADGADSRRRRRLPQTESIAADGA